MLRATGVLIFIGLCGQNLQAAEIIDFNRDIRPILSNHCFQCHGSDEATREADLRLDLRGSAMSALVPGDIHNSEMIARVEASDPDLHMPPASANKPLSQTQIDLLKQWIAEGAAYDDHWAFRSTPLCLENIGTKSSASRRCGPGGIDSTLVSGSAGVVADSVGSRRLYQQQVFDCLPGSPAATVEQPALRRTLSPTLLDQARYADPHGYTIDGARVMWPFRDYWVIKAFNDDMPFDQFTVEQLRETCFLTQPSRNLWRPRSIATR